MGKGGGAAGVALGRDVADSLSRELAKAGDKGSKAMMQALAAGFPAAQRQVENAARGYAAALTRVMQPGGKQAADAWSREFQRAVAARDAAKPFKDQLAGGGGSGGGGFASLGAIAGGSFIGSLGASALMKVAEIGAAIAGKLKDAVASVLEGGWDRLVKLDTARTKMLALKVSAADTELVMKNALESVKGTAFGLGDAATVAASALAAGVKPGQALTDYLKLTADTAAVARKAGEDMGSAFNEVGSILNRVTTQGYATNAELDMLSDKGLPIYQNLAKNLNTTAGEVFNLASKSGIAASEVRRALQDTVGGAALKMGESFEGGMENARAALDRLGEALLKPIFQPTKDGVSGVTAAIDELTQFVKDNQEGIVGFFGGVGEAAIVMGRIVSAQVSQATAVMGMMGQQFGAVVTKIAQATNLLMKPLQSVPTFLLGPYGQAIKSFGDDWVNSMQGLGSASSSFGTTMMDLSGKAWDFGTVTLPKLGESMDDWVKRTQAGIRANQAYSKSQQELADAFKVDPAAGEALYQKQMAAYNDRVKLTEAMGGDVSKIPKPLRPGEGGSTATGGMPADVTKADGGSGKKPDAALLFPGGTAIPSLSDFVSGQTTPLTDSATDLSVSATDLSGAASALNQAAARSTAGFTTGFTGTLGLNPNNVSTSGLKPQSMAALAAIQGQFPNIPLSSGFRATDPYEWHPGGRGLDLGIPNWDTPQGKAVGDQVNAWILANKELLGVYGTLWQVADHYNHIHVSIKDELSPLLTGGGAAALSGVPMTSSAAMPSIPMPSMPGMPAVPGAWTPADPTKVREQEQKIHDLEISLQITEQRLREMKADTSKSQQMSALAEYEKQKRELQDAKGELENIKKGKTEKVSSSSKSFDFNQLPFGHPARIMAGAITGAGGSPEDALALLSPMFGAVASPIGQVAGDVVGSVLGMPLPGPMGYPGVPTAPSTDLSQLVQQQNPLALAAAAGIAVPDYARFGGGPGAQDLTLSGGPPTDAMGRMYSDTAALIDRTFTNMDAADKARHDQTMTVLNEVRERLAGDYVGPVATDAVTSGITNLAPENWATIGTAIGNTAGPIIGSAVAQAVAGAGGQGTGGALVNTSVMGITNAVGAIAGMATGGPVFGGTPGVDSVPALLMPNEYVLTVDDVRRMGGTAAVDRFRAALYTGGIRRYATGGGVDVSSSVGAEFFGVGQIPLISTIVNLLIAVLLKVIGVQIQARDTLNEISSDFREYRGDFKAFDASGRMMNDTSGLIDRTGSSEQAAADERIRILKLVLEGLFKFIVEKIIVPIGKAVGNSLLQAASGAVQGAMGAAFPGGSIVGGVVGNVITSAGSTAIEIGAEVGTIVAESTFSVAQDAVGSLLQSLFPGITNGIFGGGILAAIFDPLTSFLNGIMGGISMVFGGLFGGLASLVPGLPFDEGGIASGTGLMPKATIRPERVLSPDQTAAFDRLVSSLTSGTGRTATTTIHAPFTVLGGEQGAREARDRLLALMS